MKHVPDVHCHLLAHCLTICLTEKRRKWKGFDAAGPRATDILHRDCLCRFLYVVGISHRNCHATYLQELEAQYSNGRGERRLVRGPSAELLVNLIRY